MVKIGVIVFHTNNGNNTRLMYHRYMSIERGKGINYEWYASISTLNFVVRAKP